MSVTKLELMVLRVHQISGIRAREALDCRGLPTVQVDVVVDGRFLGRADVPGGQGPGGAMSRWGCATAAAVSAASACSGR